MEKFKLSRAVESLEPSVTFEIDAKVKELQKKGVKVYNLNLGEPDFHTPDEVKTAAMEAIFRNETKYTAVQGTLELREAICGKFKRDNDLIYKPEEIIVSNGAKQALYLAVRTVCDVGDEIIILAPYWTSYPDIVRLAGGKPVIVRSEILRLLDVERVRKAITPKTKAIIVNSPNNPTGAVYNYHELFELGMVTCRHNILVISDEIYENFFYNSNNKPYSFASIDPGLRDRTLTINGVSKTYAMTGWRIGYCAGPEYIIKKMTSLQSHVSSSACSVSQAAAVKALLGDQALIREMVREFNMRKSFICGELLRAGIPHIQPEGAYYVFFRVEPKFNSIEFCRRMLDDFQVALNPGDTFGTPGWVRLSYTVGLDDIKEAMRRIKALWTSKEK